MTKKHFSEADLLETYYMQPGESMPVMMHLASCTDCAARYERLERKLREAASCAPEKHETFWLRQRISIMRKIDAQKKAPVGIRFARAAAAAALAFLLGGMAVYNSLETPDPAAPPTIAKKATPPATTATQATQTTTDVLLSDDPWQSEELKDLQKVVEWESWENEKQPPQPAPKAKPQPKAPAK